MIKRTVSATVGFVLPAVCTLKSVRERQGFGLATQEDVHEALIATLETKVRLSRALRA